MCFSILGLLYGAISLPHQIWRESMSQDIKAIYCQRTGCKDLVIKFDLPYWGFGRQFTSGQKLRLPNLIKRKTSKDEMSKKSDNSNSKHILSRPNLRLISTTLLTYDLVWIVQCAAIQLDTSSLTHILLIYTIIGWAAIKIPPTGTKKERYMSRYHRRKKDQRLLQILCLFVHCMGIILS